MEGGCYPQLVSGRMSSPHLLTSFWTLESGCSWTVKCYLSCSDKNVQVLITIAAETTLSQSQHFAEEKGLITLGKSPDILCWNTNEWLKVLSSLMVFTVPQNCAEGCLQLMDFQHDYRRGLGNEVRGGFKQVCIKPVYQNEATQMDNSQWDTCKSFGCMLKSPLLQAFFFLI